MQKMGAHETLSSSQIKYQRTGPEWSGLELKTRLLNGTEENIYIYVTLCNHHKLNTKGTEGNGTDWKKRLISKNKILYHYRRTCCMSGQ